MIRCPLCRARYRGGESCRRCGAGLHLLLSLERAADIHACHAVHRLADGNMDQALYHARKARKRKATIFNRFLEDFTTKAHTD